MSIIHQVCELLRQTPPPPGFDREKDGWEAWHELRARLLCCSPLTHAFNFGYLAEEERSPWTGLRPFLSDPAYVGLRYRIARAIVDGILETINQALAGKEGAAERLTVELRHAACLVKVARDGPEPADDFLGRCFDLAARGLMSLVLDQVRDPRKVRGQRERGGEALQARDPCAMLAAQGRMQQREKDDEALKERKARLEKHLVRLRDTDEFADALKTVDAFLDCATELDYEPTGPPELPEFDCELTKRPELAKLLAKLPISPAVHAATDELRAALDGWSIPSNYTYGAKLVHALQAMTQT